MIVITVVVHGPSRAEQPGLGRFKTVGRILPSEQPPKNGSGQDHQIARAARSIQIRRTLPSANVSRKARIFQGFPSILRRTLHLHRTLEGRFGVEHRQNLRQSVCREPVLRDGVLFGGPIIMYVYHFIQRLVV